MKNLSKLLRLSPLRKIFLRVIKAERIEYARRIERIETEKARERMSQGGKGGLEYEMKSQEGQENFPYLHTNQSQTRDIAAQKAGIGSGKQYEREKYIVDKDIYRESTLTHFRTQLIIYLTGKSEGSYHLPAPAKINY